MQQRIELNTIKYFMESFSDTPQIKQLQSTQLAQVKSLATDEQLHIENLYICHVTSYFPVDGIIRPRYSFGLSKAQGAEWLNLKPVIESSFSVLRNTIHFSINAIADAHKDHSGWDNDNIIIVDHLPTVKDQIVGGYIEDAFCIGAFKLSSQAALLIHESKREDLNLKSQLKSLPTDIIVIYYQGEKKQALEQYLKSKNSTLVEVINDPIEYSFYGTLNNHYISSQTIMNSINGNFCAHDITPMAQIETMIGKREVNNKPPYLTLLQSKNAANIQDEMNYIGDCLNLTSKCFRLTDSAKYYFEKYKNVITKFISIFRLDISKDKLISSYPFYKEELEFYDYPPDLTKPALYNSTLSSLLSAITKLNFSLYCRTACSTIFDAVYQVPANSDYQEIINTTFLSQIKNFVSVDNLKDNYYIVIGGLNLKEIYTPIYKAITQCEVSSKQL